MRALGLDLGTVTLGIAISRTGIISTGYEEFRFPDSQFETALKEVVRIVKLEDIDNIAIGLPLNMNGSESQMCEKVHEFVKMIEKELPNIKIHLIDERLSSVQANNTLLEFDLSRKKRKKVIDQMAAQIILETFLERGY